MDCIPAAASDWDCVSSRPSSGRSTAGFRSGRAREIKAPVSRSSSRRPLRREIEHGRRDASTSLHIWPHFAERTPLATAACHSRANTSEQYGTDGVAFARLIWSTNPGASRVGASRVPRATIASGPGRRPKARSAPRQKTGPMERIRPPALRSRRIVPGGGSGPITWSAGHGDIFHNAGRRRFLRSRRLRIRH